MLFMKPIFLFLGCIFSVASFGQTRPFFGRVLDDHKQGIPFAVVEVKGRNEGVYANESGVFAFTGNADSIRAIVISCLGYEQKEISTEILPLDSIIIELQPRVATLKQVNIRGRKGDAKEGILGKNPKKLNYTGDCYRFYGSETAILLKDKDERDGTLKDVYVYITNDGDPYTKFRVHVYSWDSTTLVPGREITDSNVIAMATSGNTWVKVDLSNKWIPVNGGLFVSIEWISGFGNNEKKLQSSINPEVNSYNGQVLGLTSDYGRESITYSRKPFHKEWEYYDPMDAQRKSGRFLNPMIYCTYRYIK
jgi:hypothetical protein